MSNFSNRICLYCNQSDEYGNLFDKCRMEPKNIPGRGLVAINRVVYEYQTYLAFEGAKEIERVERIKTYIQSINAKCAGTAARKIPEVPHTLDAAYVRSTIEDAGLSDMQVPIGIDYDTVEYVTIDLSKALTIGVNAEIKLLYHQVEAHKDIDIKVVIPTSQITALEFSDQLCCLHICGKILCESVGSTANTEEYTEHFLYLERENEREIISAFQQATGVSVRYMDR